MGWYTRAANVFRQNRLLRHLDDELRFHVAERTDELVAGGMSVEDARTEALRRFGNYTRQRERTRDMNIVAWLEALVADMKFGARQLRLNPGFTAVAVLSLALGIGANGAIFQLINALRLRNVPAVEKPSELASIERDGSEFYTSGWHSARRSAFTYAQFEELRRTQQAFTGMLAFGTTRFNLARSGEARYAEGLYVSRNFLDLLGVQPAFGSGFTGNVDGLDCSHVGAVLSHAFWQREFAGDPSAIGRELYVEGRMLPIVAITPPAFVGLEPGRRFDVAVPLCADALFAREARQRRQERRDAWWLTLVGRLRPEWDVTRAAAHIRGLSSAVFRASLPPTYRPDEAGKYLKNRLTVKDARSGLSPLERYEDPLWMLLTVAGLVLLIACANLANLLLARASARQREMAVRQAVGASRTRLVAQLCSESLLLAGIGAVLGLAIAQVASRALVAFLTNQDEPLVLSLALDGNVFGFITALGVLTCLLFGVVPALRATGTPPGTAMQGGRGTSQVAEKHLLRQALVVTQVATSLVLLFGALLFGQTLRNLLTTQSGMVPEGILVTSVDARVRDLTPAHRRVVFNDMQERIGAQPGVVAVAQVALSPFSGNGWNGRVREQGAGADRGKESWFNSVSPGYFDTMKTTRLAGRDFGAQDTLSAPKVAIVNEEFARQIFRGGNPIGRTFRADAPADEEEPVYQVVGLVRNTKYNTLREEFKAIAFLPLAQDDELSERVTFVVRSQAPLGTTMSGIRQLIGQMQRDVLVEFRVLDVQVAQSVLRERLMATVSGAFGALATVLSTIGLYGVMAYMVARRKSEIGVRLALGARADHILRLVLLEAGRLVALGLLVGAGGAYIAARYAQSLLFGLQFDDVPSLAAGCVLLAMTGALAALVPAIRALRLDPAVVLRSE